MKNRYKKVVIVTLIFIGLIVIGLFVVVRFYSSHGGAPKINIVNNSAAEITEILIEGNGCLAKIDKIAPDEAQTVILFPHGESGLSVSFRSKDGKIHKKDDLAYIEGHGGYFVNISISDDLDIKVLDVGLTTY